LYASANGGYSFAVYGDSLSTSAGTGVSGHGGTGVSGFGGVYGVYGSSSGAGSDGVYGTCSGGECYAGYFAGPVTITGALTVSGGCTGCSDSRLKQNVKPLAGAMDQLLQLKGVTFEWQDPVGTHHERETGTVRGFIAQDVEKVFPDWVDDKGYIAPDGQKYRTLDTRQIEALEVESIRTLKDMADKANARADKAEKEIAALKAHNADNDARLDAIERGHPRAPVSPIGFNPATGLGAFGIVFGAVAGVFVARRKQGEKRA
jgi:hypothetical protein